MRNLGTTIAIVALATSPSQADILFFGDQGQFQQQCLSAGKVTKGVEDFEESLADPGAKLPFPNSLQHGVPRPSFPNGIDAENLIIQTNITPGPCPPTANPSSFDRALWVNGVGFLGSNSIKVGTDEFLNGMFSSIDLIFTSHDKTGVGLDVSTYPGFNQGHAGFIVCVYDDFDNILGAYTMPGPTPSEPDKTFFGVWSTVAIGRVNVWGIFDVPQPFAIDNIEMWVPEPSSAALLAMGLALASRMRGR